MHTCNDALFILQSVVFFIFIYVIYLPETQNCTAVNAKVYSPESSRKRVFMLTETVSLPGAWRFIYLQDSDTSVMCGFQSDRRLNRMV